MITSTFVDILYFNDADTFIQTIAHDQGILN
jgi:hypothetical protein